MNPLPVAPPTPPAAAPGPDSDPDDAALVAAAQAGDRAALDALVRRHHGEVTRLMWRFARRRADLEDLVQDVFVRLVRALPSWRAEQPFLHWLRRVAVNAGRDHCRREAVRSRWAAAPSADPDAPPPEAIAPGTDPAARLAADEAKALLAHLPPDDRTLLTLHYLEGWEFARIGELLGWSGPATKLRAFRARRRLQSLLKNHDLP
ncbi:MAG TPA: sigma-70 family RNA polymerase sigma factor [Opitutaceae bacterium]|nr:sigma-70 family RNA polymerase sigma factor [Opitutaceae bacterium]